MLYGDGSDREAMNYVAEWRDSNSQKSPKQNNRDYNLQARLGK